MSRQNGCASATERRAEARPEVRSEVIEVSPSPEVKAPQARPRPPDRMPGTSRDGRSRSERSTSTRKTGSVILRCQHSRKQRRSHRTHGRTTRQGPRPGRMLTRARTSSTASRRGRAPGADEIFDGCAGLRRALGNRGRQGAVRVLVILLTPGLPGDDLVLLERHEVPRALIGIGREVVVLAKRDVILDRLALVGAP